MDSGGGWLRAHLKPPGVLLLRRPGPAEAMGVTVAMFGHTGLGMLICRCESVSSAHSYALTCMSLTVTGTLNPALFFVSGRAERDTLERF